MSFTKLRIATGTAPYAVTIKNYGGSTLYTTTTSTPEVQVPDETFDGVTDGFIVTIVDATSKVGIIKKDIVTYKLLKKYHYGLSITNPSIDNIVEAVQAGKDRGFTFAATIPDIQSFNVEIDSTFNQWGNTTYDHTVAPVGGIYACPFDRAVREAYISGNSLENRVVLRVTLAMTFQAQYLNNGTTKTQFIDISDTCLRMNGSPLVLAGGGDYAPGSFSSSKYIAWSKKFTLGFVKRYLAAINDGTIMCFGFCNSNSGEAEYEPYSRGYSPNEDALGDFHPEAMSAFKALYPQYAGLNNGDIGWSDRNGTVLARRWGHFLGEQLRKYEWALIENILLNVPGLTRTQFAQCDSGSFLDGLAPRRRSFNLTKRVHPASFLIKSNDNPGDSAQNKFIMDHLSSMARKYGCLAMTEPSPQGFDFGSSECINMALTARDYGVSISIFGYSPIAPFTNAGVFNRSTPAYKDEFKDNHVNRMVFPLSSIYDSGGSYVMRVAYDNYKAANNVNRVDIYIQDDVS